MNLEYVAALIIYIFGVAAVASFTLFKRKRLCTGCFCSGGKTC